MHVRYAAGALLVHKNVDGHDVRDILQGVHQKRLCDADVCIPDEESLLEATETNDRSLLQLCLSAKTSLDIHNDDGVSPLGLASYFCSTECVRLLAEHKADPNAVARNGATPLLLAVHEGHTDVVRVLTARYSAVFMSMFMLRAVLQQAQRALTRIFPRHTVCFSYSSGELDQTITLGNNTTALYIACQEGRSEIVDLLLKHSTATVDICSDARVSPLYVATHENQIECIRMLLEAKTNVNFLDKAGTSALYIATQKGHVNACELLLQAGADSNLKNKAGSSPLEVAVFHCNAPIVRLMLDSGAAVDEPIGSDGSTAAMMAAGSLDVDILCQLLLHGASINKRNDAGGTVNDILRSAHGLDLLDIAYYGLGRHPELDKLSSDEGKDLAKIHSLFSKIDSNGDKVITQHELQDALTKWGMASKYVQLTLFFVGRMMCSYRTN